MERRSAPIQRTDHVLHELRPAHHCGRTRIRKQHEECLAEDDLLGRNLCLCVSRKLALGCWTKDGDQKTASMSWALAHKAELLAVDQPFSNFRTAIYPPQTCLRRRRSSCRDPKLRQDLQREGKAQPDPAP